MGKKTKQPQQTSVVLDTQILDPDQRDQIHAVVKDSNQTAHRILDLANETHKLGKETQETLNDQGKRIDQLDQDTQVLDYQVKKNKRTVKGIRSFFWAVINFLTPKCLKPQPPEFDEADITDQDEQKRRVSWQEQDSIPESGSHLTILYEAKTKTVADDTSKVLSSANDRVHDLKDLAQDMNQELKRQNKKLDTINDTADNIHTNLDKTNKHAKRYLG